MYALFSASVLRMYDVDRLWLACITEKSFALYFQSTAGVAMGLALSSTDEPVAATRATFTRASPIADQDGPQAAILSPFYNFISLLGCTDWLRVIN